MRDIITRLFIAVCVVLTIPVYVIGILYSVVYAIIEKDFDCAKWGVEYVTSLAKEQILAVIDGDYEGHWENIKDIIG